MVWFSFSSISHSHTAQSKLENWTKQKEKAIWSFLCCHWLAGVSIRAGKKNIDRPSERSCRPFLAVQNKFLFLEVQFTNLCLPMKTLAFLLKTLTKPYWLGSEEVWNFVIYQVLMIKYLTIKEAWVVYYTVIKYDGHLRTRGIYRKHEPQGSVFFISQVFANVWSVLPHCNARLRLLHLLYDVDACKTIKHAFLCFILIKHGILTNHSGIRCFVL